MTMSRQQIELQAFLAGVRRRWTMTAALRAAGSAAAGGGAIVLTAVIVDRVWLPSDLPLVVLALTALVAAVVHVAWALWPLRRLPTARQVARFVEERVPELEDRLASAAELGDRPAESGLYALMLADAAEQVQRIALDRVVARARLRRAIGYGAVSGVALAVVLGLAAEPARRAVGAAWLYAFPNTIRIEVLPGDARIIAGQPLRVHARISGVAQASGRTRAFLQVESSGEWRDIEMQPVENGFQFDFASIVDSFRYRVVAASARSAEYTVDALVVPHVDRIDVEYDYPAFTGLDRRVELDGGDIYAPAGTSVTLVVHADKPVVDGAMVLGDGTRVALTANDATTLTGAFEVSADDAYRVALSGVDGLSNPGEMQYFIRAIDDRPPNVRILRPEGDRSVTPLEEVTIEARADDDYGLDRFELVYAVRGGEEQAVPFPGSADARTRAGTHILYVEDLDVEPGDFVTYYARALDQNRAKASNEARSDIFFLDVTPFEQEFVEAQSQSQSSDGGTGLSDLTAAQREIIVATWKLDRRPADAALDDDVRTVARAQGELKLRAEQLVQDLGGRQARGGVTVESAAGDPLDEAVRAMGEAQTELDGLQTSNALPHEMEALNQLLHAQAEIRRREVARQQAAGGGGSGRAGQDLSALFDQELRRQQQTNYETRSSARQRSATPETEALARVRELAERQDDVSRRQRDLSRRQAELDPEAFQRELERLTREQSELRRQAEELARALDQMNEAARQASGEPAGDPSGRSARASGGERMREISESMRGASSGLRRVDLDAAGEQGQQALARLRRLEQELRSLDPEERMRAVAELQMEARALAERQRQVARETEQLKASAASQDARQRLADQQEQMADRVERLERGATDLARATEDPATREALDEAAGTLDAERIAERLRESAEAFREAFESTDAALIEERTRLANSEQALAEAMARAASEIGEAPGEASSEARQLSAELAGARDLRARLADLERQLDALARADDAGGADAPEAEATDVTGELARLAEDYERELRRAEDVLDGMRRENPSMTGTLAAALGLRDVRSAPGTEAFKQDFALWDELRRDVGVALERFEASRLRLLEAEELAGRLSAGADDRVPDAYRALVDAYYEALAVRRRP